MQNMDIIFGPLYTDQIKPMADFASKHHIRLVIPFTSRQEFSSNYIFPTVLKECTSEKRDAIRDRLAECGIQTSVHYPAIHKFSVYEEFTTNLPNTEYVTDNEITLPMYSGLTDESVNYICDKYLEAVKEIL